MPSPPLYTSWLVQCGSPEASQALQRRLSGLVRLDALMEDKVRTYQGGVEKCQVQQHRLGDYFADIRLLPAPGKASAFRLVFQRLPQAGRFWKDLMVNIIQETQSSPEATAITLDYKGNQEPLDAADPERADAGASQQPVPADGKESKLGWSKPMTPPRVYADFQNLDDQNRLRLTCPGTLQDLKREGIQLREGMARLL